MSRYHVTQDHALNPELSRQVGELRGGMLDKVYETELPPRFTASPCESRPAVVFTDTDTGRTAEIPLFAARGFAEGLAALFASLLVVLLVSPATAAPDAATWQRGLSRYVEACELERFNQLRAGVPEPVYVPRWLEVFDPDAPTPEPGSPRRTRTVDNPAFRPGAHQPPDELQRPLAYIRDADPRTMSDGELRHYIHTRDPVLKAAVRAYLALFPQY